MRIKSLMPAVILAGAVAVTWAFDIADRSRDPQDENLFQFIRIRYNGYMSSSFGGQPPWAHDYPQAEQNFLKILSELTSVETTPRSFKWMNLDDPDITRYPFLYVSEPGFWDPTDEEVENLRRYLDRGGFVLFDDFRGRHEWAVLEDAIRRVYPARQWEELPLHHPVFHCFYDIDSLELPAPYQVPGKPTFLGLSDENGRLQMVAAFNNDIGDYWEWSNEGFVPIALSNEAYKFGVNFVVYSMTH